MRERVAVGVAVLVRVAVAVLVGVAVAVGVGELVAVAVGELVGVAVSVAPPHSSSPSPVAAGGAVPRVPQNGRSSSRRIFIQWSSRMFPCATSSLPSQSESDPTSRKTENYSP